MPTRRMITVVLSVVAVVGLSVTMAQRPGEEPAERPLDTGTTAVRLVLGIGDETPQDWSGRVTLDKGEILRIEGVRFRDGDRITGRDAWTVKSRLIRTAPRRRKPPPKRKAWAD